MVAPALKPVPTWDRVVRLGHWLLALSFGVAYLSAESERWRLVHVASGCVLVACVVMRVIWGFIGTRHARFSSFVKAPPAIVSYAKSMLQLKPEHHTGHNPAGGWAIVGLLTLSAAASATGLLAYNDWGGSAIEHWHEWLANLALLLVLIHIAAVFLSSFLHRENLVRAMFSGKRWGQAHEAIEEVSVVRVVTYFLLLALLGYALYRMA